MSTITYVALTGTSASETLTANVNYDPVADTYDVVSVIYGAGGNDVLTALSMPITVNGQVLDFGSSLDGNDGNDVLYGGNRNDTLSGEAGSDTLYGGDGNDQLAGGGGNDAFYGGNGDDNMSFDGAGFDTFDGGAGNDTLSVVNADLSNSTFTNVEHLYLDNLDPYVSATAAQLNSFSSVGSYTGFHLTLTSPGSIGSNFDPLYTTGGGYSSITGSSGADTIDMSGASDHDHLYLYSGDNLGGNVLIGGSADDQIYGGNGGNTLIGNGGNDWLTGGGGSDGLYGGSGNDSLNSGPGSDTLDGGDGNDILNGQGSHGAYYGGAGDDTIDPGSLGFDTIDGGSGNDFFYLTSPNTDLSHSTITGVETLQLYLISFSATAAQINSFTTVGGGDYNAWTLTLTTPGSIGSNFDYLDDFNSTIIGSSGADTIDVSQSSVGSRWTLSAGDNLGGNVLSGGAGGDVLNAGNGGDTLNGNGGNDTLNGGGGNDYLSGGIGNDSLYGGGGNDTIDAGTGTNTIDGGAGTDTANYTGFARSSFTITDLGSGHYHVVGNGHDDTLSNVEVLKFSDQTVSIGAPGPINGTVGNDQLYGTAGNDTFYGGAGNDVLVGLAGDDLGYGGDGNDYFYAGAGNDTLIGDAGLDVLLGEDGNDALYGGTGFNYLFGGAGTDTLLGSGGVAGDVNVMFGDDGADYLYGGLGTNYFYGGAGVDTMYGGAGLNIFISSGETDGNLIYGGSGQNYVYGSNGGDTVTGGSGVDVFLMGSGNDVISGGGGVDYAWGGGGADTFAISDTMPEVMVIQDFNSGGTDDFVNFAGTSLHSFADVQAAEFYSPGINTTIVTDASGNAAWLIGVAPGQLDASMFKFS
ncbi:calcium-binding protein [Bradyrhizobium sp. 27S5]|uniref:beta strand repeat-containing protein n=1 Tax=Bradyrhizobium sp. 27S5 TaxID=3139728 RepID=UPI0030CD3499